MSDNDGHSYVVRVENTEEFYKWLNEDTESENFDPEKFEMIGGDPSCITFTDPKED